MRDALGEQGPGTAFTKESLSPRPVPDQAIPLPFDLTWSELTAALPADEFPGGDGHVAIRRFELQGLRSADRSTVVTVEGADATIDLFIKLATTAERDRHTLLQAARVPVPRLLAAIERSDGQLVLVFEFLDTIGIDTSDRAEVDELLGVVARMNAAEAAGEVPPLRRGRPEAEFTESVRRALGAVVDLGLAIHPEIESWLRAYFDSKRRVVAMPQALTHGEFYFQQVGRSGRGPLVVLDHATVALRARFSDLCSILAPLATHSTESEIFGRYLTHVRALGVATPDHTEAFEELRWLRILTTFQSLPWLTESYNNPHLGLSHLEERVATLEHDLSDLNALHD